MVEHDIGTYCIHLGLVRPKQPDQGRELVLVQADPDWYLRTSEEFVSDSSERIAKKLAKKGTRVLFTQREGRIGRRTVRHTERFVSDRRALPPPMCDHDDTANVGLRP